MLNTRASLPAIITAARAGALDHAERLFAEAGHAWRHDDPAVLAVRARLAKDRALQMPQANRTALLAQAAADYAAADTLLPQPYTRINFATMALLSGDETRGREIAGSILSWLDRDTDLAETPFHIAATRAQALLLRREPELARTALDAARRAAPSAHEDMAATLRDLTLVAEAQGLDTLWLEEFRPPRSVHYAGHLGVSDGPVESLVDRIDALLDSENIGFGFGALAAGSDIVVAERLLARGCELHVVMPIRPEAFAEQSVVPYGGNWPDRFAACLEAATAVTATAGDTGEYEPLATSLASDAAMGAAALHARRLSTEAVQVLILDEAEGRYGAGLSTARDGRRWTATGRRSHTLRWPRETAVVASGDRAKPEGRADRRLAAMLHISFLGLDELDEREFADAVDTVLEPMRQACAALSTQPEIVLPCGNSRTAVFATPEAAWDYARALLAMPPKRLPLRIAGHYALGHWLGSPSALAGRGVNELERVSKVALPGVFTATEVFTTALCLAAPEPFYAEPIGDAGHLRIFAVREG